MAGNMTEDYIRANKLSWDERAPEHAKSPSGDYLKLLKNPTHLSDVVRFDIPLLPNITGLDIVHLQCHIATDTISLARRGAKSVTGIDFSPASLAEAKRLAESAAGGEKLSFVEGSVYDSLTLLEPASFDMVFTGVGALCWLPDIRKWAHVVASLLKPGGRFFIREAHPILWAMDDAVADRLQLGYPYFERMEPTVFQNEGTYMELEDNDHKFAYSKTLEWNHGMGEIVQALLDEGMMITGLVEHRTVPWDALPGQMKGCKDLPGEFELKEGKDRMPLSYTLQAFRKR